MTASTAPQSSAEQPTIVQEMGTAVRHTAVYGLGNILLKAVGFVMVPFYTHYLSPAEYGILEILDLSMSLFGMFLAIGMISAMLRAYAAAESEEQRRSVISTSFIFVSCAGIGVYVLLGGLVRPVSTWLLGPQIPAKYLLISFSTFILGYILNVPRTYLRARESSGAFVAVDSLGVVAMLVLVVVFIVIFKMGLLGILISSLIVAAGQLSVLTFWMLRHLEVRFDRGVLWKMLVFGFPLMFSNMALFVLNFSDRFFLQHLRSLEVVGVYAVGYKFGYMLNYLLVQPFLVMWQGRMYVVHRNPDHENVFGQMFVLYSLLLTYAGLGLAVLSPEIVRFMVGARFAGSQDVIPVVGFAYVFFGIAYFAQTGMYVTERTRLVGGVSAAAAILNLGLNFVLIRQFGMMGAAWATLLSFLAIAAGSYAASQRVLPLALGGGRVAAALITAAGLYGLCRFFAPHALVTALLFKAVVLSAFPVLVWKTGILSGREIETIRSAWSQLAGKCRTFSRPPARGVESI